MKRLLFVLFFMPFFTRAQIITTVVGTGLPMFSGDGGPASAATLYEPQAVIFDNNGTMYISDGQNSCIRTVNTSGIINTIAGMGPISGYGGDGGPATAAELYYTEGIAFDGAGNLYVADVQNNVVRKVNTSGIITTFAGDGNFGFSGDGGPATDAQLKNPAYIAIDGSGNVYICDYFNGCIRKVNTAGMISTFAGMGGVYGNTGDGGPATAAKLLHPSGIAIDPSDNIYILDGANSTIRKVNSSGIITTIAGNGTPGYSGDGGPATAAQISGSAVNLSFDGQGNLYFADYNVIRRINSSQIISTYAGDNSLGFGFSGDGGPATACQFYYPAGIGFDNLGNAYIPDANNSRIRKITNPFASVSSIPNSIETNIYPNPATTSITITSPAIITCVAIKNLIGQTIYIHQYTSPQIQVDVSTLPAGIYFVKINNTEVRKFVKQ